PYARHRAPHPSPTRRSSDLGPPSRRPPASSWRSASPTTSPAPRRPRWTRTATAGSARTRSSGPSPATSPSPSRPPAVRCPAPGRGTVTPRGVRGLLERRFGPGALAGRGRRRRTAAAGPAVVARARRGRVLRAAAAGGRRRGRPRTAGGGPAFGEAGRALLPGPLIATHLAAGTVPGAATGETVVAAVDGGLVEW